MRAETRRVLELWVEKARLLQDRNFMKRAMDRESFVLRSEGKPVAIVTSDDEPIDAALLTVRMFLQCNDDLSLRKLATKWLADPDISQGLREWVTAYRDHLNARLDGPCGRDDLHVVPITNRVLLETFLYGIYGHSDATKRARIKEWRERGTDWFVMLEHLFTMVVVDVVSTIINIAYVIQFELA